MEDRVVVGSFSYAEMKRFRRITGGRVRTSAAPHEVAAYVLCPWARPLRRLKPMALQIPHRRHHLTIASRGVIRRAHANGLEVHVWTIDDPAEMELLLDRGVDGLMTDRTDILKSVLTVRGLWEAP